jgi:membrane-bound inhibitor of C-type lysozyme
MATAMTIRCPSRGAAALVLAATVLAGCGNLNLPNLLPFGGARSTELNQTPENATEYRCQNNTRFYVRRLDDNAIWLILPDRQVRLGKSGGGYAAGRLTLVIEGTSATVQDPPTSYADCRIPGPEKDKAEAAK